MQGRGWGLGSAWPPHLVQGLQLQAVKAQFCLQLLHVHPAHGLSACEVLEAALESGGSTLGCGPQAGALHAP